MSNFRTRQAPSPTGYLHFGTARQMLFTKLIAKINNGKWFLRLEDTDRNRLQTGSVGSLLNSLESLGLLPDEGINNKDGVRDEFYNIYQIGEFGPYIQSERLAIYHEHAQKMIEQKLAYWCFLTDEEKEELQTIKKATKTAIDYFKVCENRYGQDIWMSVQDGLKDERKPTLRYKIQRNEKVIFEDVLLGKSEFDLNLEEDFVILKSDGFPTYHLAHIIDDYLMQTSLIVRAQEWFPSTAKHITMFQDYWQNVPKYLHLPVILGETGNKKMSKRDGNVNMEDYLNSGYLSEAIINYLAFLGWNPGTDKELYLEQNDFNELNLKKRLEKLIDNLVLDFSIDKLNKSPSRFNLEKLNWFNREYIKMMKLGEFSMRAFAVKKESEDKKIYIYDDTRFNLFVKKIKNEKGERIVFVENLKDEGDLANIVSQITGLQEFNFTKFAGGFLIKTQENILKPYFEKELGQNYVEYGWMSAVEYFKENPDEFMPFYVFLKTNMENINEFEKLFTLHKRGVLFDKERVNVLKEIGVDSSTINNWQKPENKDLIWKKGDVLEAKENLQKVYENVIAPFYEADEAQEILKLQNQLLKDIADDKNYEIIKENFTKISYIWENILKEWIKTSSLNTGSVLWPLRVALSGEKKSPSPFEILAILEENEVKHRIEKTLSHE